MELIKANNLNLHNGSKDILIDANFRILEGGHYGLIGPNGVGKTTLIRLILEEEFPDSGRINRKPELQIGYLPQQPIYKKKMKIQEFLLSDLNPVTEKMRLFEEQMSSADGDDLTKLLEDYQILVEEFEAAGGYKSLEKSEQLLKRLGMDNQLNQEMGSLSGGERSLVYFAKSLLVNPDLLILDEPGNHLDYLGLAWLEAFLKGYKGAVLIVSHNRYLLDKTCTQLFDMFKGKLTGFTGNYSALKREKLKKAAIALGEFESSSKKMDKLDKKIKQLQSVAMSQYNPPDSIMRQLNSAKRKLADEKKKELEKPVIEEKSIFLKFNGLNSKSHFALQVKNFCYNFDKKILFENAEMEILCGEFVALVGPNGSGKTTLIKAVLNYGDWERDILRIGPGQTVGYLSQVPSFHKDAVSIEDEVRSWGPISRDGAFGIAGFFSFTYEDMKKPLRVLSGGEVNRLQLARLMYLQTTFLILDEPTNHMDIKSREAIEEALRKYNGTILVVSHDRFFLDQLVTRIVEIDNKKLVSFQGNFSEYFKEKYPVLPRLNGSIKTRGGERLVRKEKNLTDSIQIEKRINETETEKQKIEEHLDKAILDGDHTKGRKLAVKLEKISSMLEKFYIQWEQSI